MAQPHQPGRHPEKMAEVVVLKPLEPQNRNQLIDILPRVDLPEDRQRPQTKTNRAVGLAMDSLDTLATVMVSIGKVSKFPYLAESAGLVVTIIDIVATMKSNKEKFRNLARRTADIVSIIYHEAEEKGRQMNVGLQTKLVNMHSQLIEIARFVQKKLEDGKIIRAIQRKPDADAIAEYEKRLDHALNAFNFQAQINNAVVLDQIAERLGVGDQSTNADKEQMRVKSLEKIDDRKEELDKKNQEMEEELERKRAEIEKNREQLEQERAKWLEQREAAEQAKKEQEEEERKASAIRKVAQEKREREEAEARNKEHEARLREHDEREKKQQEEAEIAERLRRKRVEAVEKKEREIKEQKQAWLIGRQALKELQNEEKKPEEKTHQRVEEVSIRTREEQENRRTEQEGRGWHQPEPDRGQRMRSEDLSVPMSNLQISDPDRSLPRPRSWNPPSQLSQQFGAEDYGSSQASQKNPFNNPFYQPPEMPRPQSAADFTDRSRRSARYDDSYQSQRQQPPRPSRYGYEEEGSYGRPPPQQPDYYDEEPSYQRPPPPRQRNYYEDEMHRRPSRRQTDYYEVDEDEDEWYGYSPGPPIPPVPVYPGIGGNWVNSGNVTTTVIKGSFNNTSRRPAGYSRYR